MSFFKYTNLVKRKVVFGLLVLLFVPALFLVPKKADAFCVPFFCLDPSQDVEGAITSGTTGVTAGASVTTASLTTAQHVKEFLLDGLATAIARQIVRQLTAQTVNWINTGFKGNPGYVTNPNQFFLSIGDNVASQFISSDPFMNSLCSPFSAQVRLAITKNYLNTTNPNYSCTLGKIAQNYDNFANNFSNGGWDSWFSITQNTTNNPYASYISGVDSLNAKIGNKQNNVQAQLNQNKGFLSWTQCKTWAKNPGVGNISVSSVAAAGSGACTPSELLAGTCTSGSTLVTNNIDQSSGDLSGESTGDTNSQGDVCTDSEVETPGSVISDQLSKVMGSSVDELNLTNSINQVVSALMTQMVQQVVGGIGKGLRGLSQSGSSPSGTSSTGGSSSLTSQMISTPSGSKGGTPTAADAEDASTKAGIQQTSATATPAPIDPGIPTRDQAIDSTTKEQTDLSKIFCDANPTQCVNGVPTDTGSTGTTGSSTESNSTWCNTTNKIYTCPAGQTVTCLANGYICQ